MALHRQGATGSLKVDGPSYHKALYFRSGRILFGSSNDPRDQLGAILIEAGKITPEQLEDVNAKVGPGTPLAKVLSDTGFVNQRELSEAARAKVERILSDVIAYTSGSFEFEDGVLPKGAIDLKLSTEKIVLAAVRRISDRAFVLRHLENLEVVLAARPDKASELADVQAETGGLAQPPPRPRRPPARPRSPRWYSAPSRRRPWCGRRPRSPSPRPPSRPRPSLQQGWGRPSLSRPPRAPARPAPRSSIPRTRPAACGRSPRDRRPPARARTTWRRWTCSSIPSRTTPRWRRWNRAGARRPGGRRSA